MSIGGGGNFLSSIGSIVGGIFGGPIGAMIGQLAGQLLSSVVNQVIDQLPVDQPFKDLISAGFKAGTGDAHRLTNDSGEDVVYLEIGDRSAGDEATYPDDDLVARESAGAWCFFHKDGRPYPPSPAPTDSAHLPDAHHEESDANDQT